MTISDCVSPRSKIGKQLRENYKNLLEVRVKEIIYYLFENLFIGSSSIGLVYVPEECSSMIHSYQLLERGKYILDSTAFSLLDTLSEQWNSPNPPPPPQVEINTTESNHLPPQRYLSSRSEANLAANTSISTDERPHTAGEALNLQEEEDSGSFLKSPLEWMRKKFTFKSKKSKLQSSTEDPGKLNSQDDKLMVDPGTGKI